MCGINGIIRFSRVVNRRELNLMNKAIKHRGPDDEGVYTLKRINYSIGLGHVRLAILDLSERGHQPMGYDIERERIIYRDKDLDKADIIIVHNGEIYNYLELKEKYNLKTETGTDTEIILKLYVRSGYDCVKEFNGMWAFAIYDKRKNLLFFSRDRLGQKPLYYYWDKKELIFSSELKGIISVKKINKKKNINIDAVNLFFALGFIPAPYSIYKNTFKLEARQNLVFDLNKKKIKKWYYWDLPRYNPIYDKKKLIKEGKKLLYDAVKLRMRSDVPVGAFLSGGLDSSSVVGIMRKFTDLSKLHTFSIGFEGKYDETPYIKIVGNHFKTNHHHYYFKEKDFEELIDKYIWVYDEPFGDYSGFPTYKVSELAKQFVTVVLSGDGGDEIFGGYTSYSNIFVYEMTVKIPKFFRYLVYFFLRIFHFKTLSAFDKFKELLRWSLYGKIETLYADLYPKRSFMESIGLHYYTKKRLMLLEKYPNLNLTELERIYNLLYSNLSDNFLVKVDRASMANALEVRSPFLDYRFAEFSQKIPTKWKVDLFKTKKLMREIIKDILPNEIVNRGKQGFTPPLTDWILKRNYLNEIIEKAEVLKEVDNELYEFFKEKVFKNKEQSLYRNYLIRLFLFVRWWEKWVRY